MQIHTLENIPIEEITTCFNKAFEGYFVPIHLEVHQLLDKIKSENIVLEYSVGVTVDNQLVGFILIGITKADNITYNAGTGVIKELRGLKITEKMYGYLFDLLKEVRIQNHVLEVICDNQKALKIYETLGYSIMRKIICYKGKISETNNSNFKIKTIELPNIKEVQPFWNHNPTYQNSLFCINNNHEKHAVLGAFDNEKLVGYIVFDKNTLRIKQFGVDNEFRNNGIGHQLFHEVQKQNPEAVVVIINVDESDFETNNFLQKIGLKKFIEQYEMRLNTN